MRTEEEILAAIEEHKIQIKDLKQWQDCALTNESYVHYEKSINMHEEIIFTLQWVLK